jgi:hypothetical protein
MLCWWRRAEVDAGASLLFLRRLVLINQRDSATKSIEMKDAHNSCTISAPLRRCAFAPLR